MCYAAYDGKMRRAWHLLPSQVGDFVGSSMEVEVRPTLTRRRNMDDKDEAIFPRKIDGKYVFCVLPLSRLDRPGR